VSNGHDDPLALSRAVFRDAVLRDDALAAARAAARLRAHDPDLGARDLEAVRASRQMLGRAIRAARARRVIGSLPASLMLQPVPAIPPRRSRRRPYAIAASIAVLAFVLAGLLARPAVDQTDDGGGGAQATGVFDPAVIVAGQSRGRVVVAVASVAIAAEEPQATAAPESSASASPAPGSGVSPAAGSGGSGGGTGGGSGSGTGGRVAEPGADGEPEPGAHVRDLFLVGPAWVRPLVRARGRRADRSRDRRCVRVARVMHRSVSSHRPEWPLGVPAAGRQWDAPMDLRVREGRVPDVVLHADLASGVHHAPDPAAHRCSLTRLAR